MAGEIPLSSLLPANGGDGSVGVVVLGDLPGDAVGYSAAGVGDFNGDGYDDFAIGARSADVGTLQDAGKVYVVFGRPDRFGPTLDLSTIDGTNGFVIEGVNSLDEVGSVVTAAGDINGDGLDDLAVVSEHADLPPEVDVGQVYVIFGRASGTPASFALGSLLPQNGGNGSTGFVVSGNVDATFLGGAASAAGDINGDGLDDLILGAPYSYDQFRNYSGLSYVLFGRATFGPTVDLRNLTTNTGLILQGISPDDHAGQSVSGAGDVNADGIDDLLVGAFGVDVGTSSLVGEAYVVFGRDSFPVVFDLASLLVANGGDGSRGFVIRGIAADDSTGFSVARGGDVNGDGRVDLVVAAPFASPGGRDGAGSTFILFGKSSFPAEVSLATITVGDGFRVNGTVPFSLAGETTDTAGDVNGDGFDDLLLGASGADGAGYGAGEAYLLLGHAGAFPAELELASLDATSGRRLLGVAPNDQTGSSVQRAGDIDGDGLADYVVGAFGAQGLSAGTPAGVAYLLFGADLTSSITHPGDATANLVQGDASANVLLARQGDDTLVGAGGGDVYLGGQGSDTIQIADTSFLRIDGGNGRDTIQIPGGVDLNLTTIANTRVQGVEEFDLRGPGVSRLSLNLREALNVSDESNKLVIRHDAQDVLTYGSGWRADRPQTVDGQFAHVFRQRQAQLTILNTTPWQNPINRLDVNADGAVSSLDIILIVDYLALHGSGDLPPQGPPVGVLPLYYDVTGRNGQGKHSVEPLDVIVVVSFFSSQVGGSGGEGESSSNTERVGPAEGEFLSDQRGSDSEASVDASAVGGESSTPSPTSLRTTRWTGATLSAGPSPDSSPSDQPLGSDSASEGGPTSQSGLLAPTLVRLVSTRSLTLDLLHADGNLDPQGDLESILDDLLGIDPVG